LNDLIPKKEDQVHFQENLILGFHKMLMSMKKYNFKQPIATAEANIAVAICRNIKIIL